MYEARKQCLGLNTRLNGKSYHFWKCLNLLSLYIAPGVGSIPGSFFGSLARRKVVVWCNWCNSPGTMVWKLPAYMTKILLGKGVKGNKQTNKQTYILPCLDFYHLREVTTRAFYLTSTH
jgi:hypothetical protein